MGDENKSRFGGGGSLPCVGCGKKAYQAERVQMDGKIWHPNCLRCVDPDCNKKLGGANWGGYIEDKPYCKAHHSKKVRELGGSTTLHRGSSWKPRKSGSSSGGSSRFGGGGEKCQKCGKTAYVAERVVMDAKIFHPNCFRCTECNKKLGGSNWGGYVGEQQDPYCKPCHRKLVQAAGGSTGFTGSAGQTSQTKETKSNPLASRFGSKNTDKCVGCGKTAYVAEKVVMDGKIWHPNCLRCKECNKKLGGSNWGGYIGEDADPYCKPCADKMVRAAGGSTAFTGSTGWQKSSETKSNPLASKFGGGATERCAICNGRVYAAEMLKLEGKVFHVKCPKCKECGKLVSGGNFGAFVPPDDDVYCKIHYDQLVARTGTACDISGSTAGGRSSENVAEAAEEPQAEEGGEEEEEEAGGDD